ncbi:DUF1129 domain-containing protein [Bacillus gaemokensis]|uniref:NADH dehydrogenase n=1 Tax=Bacillus gaemokensis TaxID=574375 RepID=A0A073KHM9_9BACI|nr:DUF1129 domain-containing protein [Bacillus gaemokensis]KEK25961.1 NADH dehydrogenase [Bacillus gaemokensis]KYG38774.1 NADH dehydrogenase [Bacillus gaemokensis]
MLTKESKRFIEETRAYLRVKGIKETDIISFLEDAELHLVEGEKQGKTVTDIFGDSPKEYADQLASEMEFDKKENYGWLIYFIVNVLAFTIMRSVLFVQEDHRLSYSLIELIGYPVMLAIGIFIFIWGMRIAAFKRKGIEFIIMCITGSLYFLAIFSIALLNQFFYGTTFIQFTTGQSYSIVAAVFLIAVFVNVKIGGWFTLLYLIVPITIEYVFFKVDLSSITGLYIQQIVLLAMLYVLAMIHSKLEKRKANI